MAEDTVLAFTGANLISVEDVDGNVTTTTLTVLHGTLTVSLSGGAAISAGANGSATLTLTGTKAQVNAALATLSYRAATNYSGSDALTVFTTNDLASLAFGVGAEYGPVAGFTYTADPILGDSRTPDKAFDGTTTESHSAGFSPSGANPFIFKITAPDPKVISSYYMSGRSLNDHKPSSWTFQGSNDDSTWTVLDTRTNIDLTSGTIVTSGMSAFTFANNAPYKYHRFVITGTTGVNVGYVVIGEMALVGQTAPADLDTIALTVTPVNDPPSFALPAGTVSTLAGSTAGSADGTGSSAQFNNPYAVAADSVGNIYVADYGNHLVRKITPAGVVTTLAGSTRGFTDGTGAAAKFDNPLGLAVDSADNVYVSEYGNDISQSHIRKITPAGEVSTLAGSTYGFTDGTGTAAQFGALWGVAVDPAGNVYVADTGNGRIRKVTAGGVVTTLSSSGGYVDGVIASAKFSNPLGLAIDRSGNVYVADAGNNRIRKITPTTGPYVLTVSEDSGPITMNNFLAGISGGPADESAQTVSFTVTNNNNALFSVQPVISAAGTLTFTPAANANGTATVTVIAQDNGGTANGGTNAGAPQTFTITVTAVNDPPTALSAALFPPLASSSVTTPSDGTFALRGVASDGVYLYVNKGGSTIGIYQFDGTKVSSTNLANLPGANCQMAFANGYLYTHEASGIYRISTNTWTRTAVSVDATHPRLIGNPWMSYNLFDSPDGRLGVIGVPSGGSVTVRLYTVSGDGLTLTWDSDYTINDSGTSDEHGLAFDGFYLYRLHGGNLKAYNLATGDLVYNSSGIWAVGSTASTGAFGNPTFLGYDHLHGRLIIGDFDTGKLLLSQGLAPITVVEDTASLVTNLTAYFSDLESVGGSLTYAVVGNSNPALLTPTITQGTNLTLAFAANRSGISQLSVKATDAGGSSATNNFLINVLPVNDPPNFALPAGTTSPAGATWNTRTNLGSVVVGLAASADGTKLVAIPQTGYIATSTDAGVTWTSQTGSLSQNWTGVASSADGTKLVALTGQPYTSTDSGVTWTARDGGRNWYRVASSADGVKLAAVVFDGLIYTSTDSGVTWTAQSGSGSRNWGAIASSADGTKLVAAVQNGQIYTSTDSGVTWTARDSSRLWWAVTSSADGTKLAAVELNGQIYTSADSGATWTARETNRGWTSIASSADGTRLAAVARNQLIYTSTDSGVTWTGNSGSGSQDWFSVASSADGAKLVAGNNPGGLFTSAGPTSLYDLSVVEDAGLQTVANFATNISAGPADESAQTVSFTVTNNNNALFSSQPAINAAGTLTFTAATNANGTATVTVIAQDNGGVANGGTNASAPQTFTITVTPVNDAPTFNPVANATGGIITTNGAYIVHTFTNVGAATFTPLVAMNVEVLVVGGGGGSAGAGGGGGGGGVVYATNLAVSATSYPVTVGAGGTANPGANGGNSVFGTVIGFGGGAGGPNQGSGAAGGSGGGAGRDNTGTGGSATQGTGGTAYGNVGGSGPGGSWGGGSGGGGAGTPGFGGVRTGSPSDERGGAGGAGISNAISGILTYYGGGGGGGNEGNFNVAAGGIGGGGSGGANNPAIEAMSGAPNTGGGGGGSRNSGAGGAGGSGIVIVRYLSVPSFTVNEDAPNLVTNLTALFSDAETAGTALTFAVVGNTNTALVTATVTQGTNLTLAFAPNGNGTSLVSVSATDPSGLSLTNSFVVTVNPVNDVPSFALRAANTQSLINNGSFETGDFTGWIVSDTVNTSPTLAVRTNGASLGFFTASASDGTKSATHGFSGTAAGTIAISQDVIVAAGGVASLAFTYRLAWSTIGSSASSGRTFRLTVQPAGGGAELLSQTVFSAAPNTAGFQSTNTPVTVDLTAFAGQSIRVGFITDIPAGDAGNGSFQLDNVRLTATTPDFMVYENSGVNSMVNLATNIVTGPANEAGETVTFVVSNNNNGLFSSQPAIAANGTVSFTPAANANGVATVSVAVRDSGGTSNGGVDTSAAQTFKITVLAVNSAPTITLATNNVVVFEDSGTYGGALASFSGAPADESGQSVTNVVTSNNNPGLFSVQPSVSTGGLLTFTTAASANGVATVTMVVQDNGGTANGGVDKSTNTFTITVLAVSDAPAITLATNNVVRLEDSGAYAASGFASFTAGPVNESGQSVTNVTTSNDNAALFSVPPSIALNGTLSFTPAPNVFGVANVQVIAQDNGGTADGGANRATNTFTITVLAVNDAPTFVLRPINTLTDLISNGSFETGDFTGWLVADTANASPSLAVRANGFNLGFFNTLATDGTKSASHGFSGANAGSISIAQELTLPTAGSATLTFAYRAGWNTFGSAATSNRTFRVSVQPAGGGAELFSTNLVAVAPNDFALQVASTPVTLNLVAFAGQSIRLAFLTDIPFGDAGSGSFQLDNVRVMATTPDLTVFENSGTTSVPNFTTNIVTGPSDEAGQTVAFSTANNNSGLFSSQPAIAANGTLTFTPATNANGVATVTVVAQDSGGVANGGVDKATNTFTITVRPAASVTRLTVPANGAYPVGSVLNFTVTFGAVLNVTGLPQLRLTLGSGTVNASYASGSGSTNLVFTYTVQLGDLATDGLVLNSPLLLNGGTIREANNADARLTFAPPITSALIVDTAAPTVTISDPSLGSASTGPVSYTVAYADPTFAASTLTGGNITLNRTGTANGTVAVTGSGATRTVTISSIVGIGTLGISLAAGTASDGAGNLAPAAGPSRTFGVLNYTPQTITFGTLSGRTYGDAPVTLTATASSALPVSYAVISGPATLNGSTLTLTGAGTVVVQASQAGDGTFSAATPVSQSLTVAKKALTVAAQNASRAYGLANPSFTATLTGFIPGETLATSGVTGTAGLSTTALTTSSPNTFAITPVVGSLSAANYSFATFTPGTLTVTQAVASVTLGNLTKTYAGSALAASATTVPAGLSVNFAYAPGSPVNVGSYTVTATVADVNYQGAATGTLVIGKASQQITFAPPANLGPLKDLASIALAATASSGLPVTLTMDAGSPATLNNNAGSYSLSGFGATGTITLRANQPGDANFLAASEVVRTLDVEKNSQIITFGALPARTFGDAAITLAATADSGLPVSYTVISGPATVSGSVLTLTGAGEVLVRASQGGNATFNAAAAVDRTFTVGKASQTITFGALTGQTYGVAPITLGATSDSSLTVAYSVVSGPAAVTNNVLTVTGAGSVVVQASQPGNANYSAATPVIQTLTVAKKELTVTVQNATRFVGVADPAFTAAYAGFVGSDTVTNLATPPTIMSTATSASGAGTYVLSAANGVDDNYAFTYVNGSLVISLTPQTITFGPVADRTFGDAPLTLAATASSGLPVSYTVVSGPALVSGSEVSVTGVGVVTVRASQAGNSTYAAASPVSQTFTVNPPPNTAPTDLVLSASTVLENRPVGTTVGTLTAADVDSADTHTFALVAGTGSAGNASFTVVGNALKTAAVLDFEAQSSYAIRLRATDNGGLFVEKQFTVTVVDVNEAPTLAVIPNPATIIGNEGLQTVSLSGISAGGGETQVLTVTATSSQPGLIPNPTVNYTSPNATGSLSYTPVASANGTAVISVTVTDNGGTANGGVNAVTRTFSVTVLGPAEINVTGNGVTIADGDSTPSLLDHTDFGRASVAGGVAVRTFTIQNLGGADLLLTGTPKVVVGGANAADFAVTQPLVASVTGGGNTAFQVSFAPNLTGLRTATLTVASSDADEGAYDFAIQGTGAGPGNPDAGFNPNANGDTYSSALQADGKMVLGGSFTAMGGEARNRIARLNADGTVDAGFNPDANGEVRSVAVQVDGRIVIGGQFTSVGGVTRNGVARLNADGSPDPAFAPEVNGLVRCLTVQPDGKLVLGGAFTTVGGVTRNRLARLNANGTLDTGFNPDVNGEVRSIAVQADGQLVLGGQFTTVGGVTRNNAARLNASGLLDAGFNPDVGAAVNTVALQVDGRVVIGGPFSSVGGVTRNRLARLNADGTLDPGFNPDANGSPLGMAMQADGKLVLGGDFTTLGAVTRNRVARLNADGTLDASFDPNVNGTVQGVMLQADGQIVIHGAFAGVGGLARNRIARLENDAATQNLPVPDYHRVTWLRSGTSPETLQVTFELSINGGTTWTSLGAGSRISGGWELGGLSLPGSAQVRARARTAGGGGTDSGSLIEAVTAFSALAPPVNDAFAGRLVIVGETATVTGFNVAATREAGEPEHAGLPSDATVWWSWTAPRNGVVTIDTVGTAFDTILAVYRGASAGALTLVAANDDAQGTTSQVSFPVTGGTTYQIVVGGLADANGDVTLNLLLPAIPMAPAITSQPVSRVVLDNAGSNVTFSVTATGAPAPAFFWQKNGVNLPGITNASFTITNALLADAGNYRVIVTNASGSVTSSVAVLTVLTASANDAFADRFPLVGPTNQIVAQNFNATREAGEPVHAGKSTGASLWWTWVAPSNGLVQVDTAGSTNAAGAVLDTVLAIYTGNTLNNLAPVAANDDELPGQLAASKVFFRAAAGVSYQIAVAGLQDANSTVAVGGILLNVMQAPDNDYFASRLSFPAGVARVRDNNVGTTKEPGERNHAFNAGGKSVWWSWVAPSNGLYLLDTAGSSFDTLLAVYTGSALNGLTLIGEHDGDPADNFFVSRVQFQAVAGTEYQFAVDGYQGAAGDVVLNLAAVVPGGTGVAANDNFVQRIAFLGQTNQVTAATTNATKESGEPNHAGNAGGHSVWWSWIAPISGPATLSTTNSSFDTTLAVYTGTTLASLSLVAENDDLNASFGVYQSSVTFPAVAGVVYQIAVDGHGDAAGMVILTLSQPTPEVVGGNDLFVNRFPITGQTNTVMGANTNATKEAGEPDHAGDQGGRSIWWRWVAPASTPVTIDTAGSSFDTLLGVYTGTEVNALALVAADHQGSVNGSTVTFLAVAGVEYAIAVDGHHDGTAPARGVVMLNVRQYPAGSLIGNDDLENATPISPQFLTVLGSNIGATRQDSEPAHAGLRQGASAWWTWTALNDGPVTIATDGSEFDTVLSVYTGASLASLSLVAENDDPRPGASRASVAFQAAAGTAYRIAVDGYRGAMGAITLTISPGADAPAAPQLEQLPFAQTRFTGGGGGGTNVEFRVVATGSLPLSYQWLRNGTNLDGATSQGLTLTNVSAADAGTYQVLVSNAYGATNSPGAEFTFVAAPFNDQFASRINIAGTSNTVRGSILEAGKEPGEPDHAGVPGGRSVWWKWTAPANGLVEVDTVGSAFDTRLAVYTNTLGSLGLVRANDDLAGGSSPASRLFFSALAGVEYQIAVDGFKTNGASGAVVLNLHPLNTSQSISFGPLPPKRVGDPSFALGATASSGLPVSYASGNPAVATVSGNMVTINGVGTASITASQPGDAIFSAASPVAQTLSVGLAPSVTGQPVALVVNATSNAVFTVTAAGTAPLGYQWNREGLALAGETAATLNLSNVATNQTGNYSVVITNLFGSVTSSVALLTVERLSQTISFGALPPGRVGDAPFAPDATASSGLPVSYASASPAVATFSGGLLTITGIGAATITASQGGDATFLSAPEVSQTLLVGVAPSVTTPPAGQAVSATSNAVFNVTAAGTLPLFFQWRRDGADLTQATNATLDLGNVQTNQAGGYSVVITNLYGSVTSSVAALTVNRLAQTITFGALPPKRLDAAPFALGATASSGLPISYTSSTPGVAGVSGNTVTLASIGTTTFTASQAGSAIYLPAASIAQDLTVTGIPPSVSTPQPANLAINSTSNVTFTVSASGTGPLGYQWYGFTPRSAGATAVALVAGGFVFDAPVTEGGRGYLEAPGVRFIGGNGLGAVGTATLSNGVVVAITINNPGFGYSSAPMVLIDPPTGLLPGETNAALTIANVGTNDTGAYFAVVTNAWGSSTSSVATLTVNVPAYLVQAPPDVVAAFGSNVSFTLGVGGTAPFNFQWYWQPATARAAVAVADVRNGFVVGATVRQGGGYYLTAPAVQILDGSGSGATATAVVTAGAVTAVNILTPGSGYSANAQIVIAAPVAGPPQLLSGQTGATLTLLSVRALDAGGYFASVSNGGGSFTSSPALLQVQVPPSFTQAPQRLPDGTFRLRFGPQDGGYLLPGDLAAFEIWGSTNLADPNAWVRITNGISLQNGQVQVDDADSPSLGRRFYRVLKQ